MSREVGYKHLIIIRLMLYNLMISYTELIRFLLKRFFRSNLAFSKITTIFLSLLDSKMYNVYYFASFKRLYPKIRLKWIVSSDWEDWFIFTNSMWLKRSDYFRILELTPFILYNQKNDSYFNLLQKWRFFNKHDISYIELKQRFLTKLR